MNRELRIFFLAVGIPALILTAIGARLVYVEWWRASHPFPPVPKHGFCAVPPPTLGGGPPGMPGFREPPDFPGRPPPPSHFFRLFSEQYGMDGARVLWIGGCILGLTFLSLVSGGWLLVKAARRSRLEAMRQTDFVSNVSHEFKTPLTTICLCAELAQDEGLAPESRRKALASVVAESERLKRLLLNALDFSRLEKGRRRYRMERLDVAEVVRGICATFSARFADGRLHGPKGECPATADADAVRQILANLLDNAVRYAPSGPVEVSACPAEGGARVTVADRGPGLGKAGTRHAFDRFWRGDNSVTRETGGSGLGLAIARSLARGMGGDLTASDREGGGAVFTLELRS